MFVIFGWGHQEKKSYGKIKPELCSHCEQTLEWHLDRVNLYFTLFFIPLIPYRKNYQYYCPNCNYGLELNQTESELYKSIAHINQLYALNKLTEIERAQQIREIDQAIESQKLAEKEIAIEKSKDWTIKMSQKSDQDLISILTKREDYELSVLIAAENELKKRNLIV